MCLADYCDMLRCSVDHIPTEPGRVSEKEATHRSLNDQLCTASGLDARRVLCQAAVHQCFPLTGGSAASDLNHHFTRRWCDKLSCETLTENWKVVSPIMLIFQIIFGSLLLFGLVFYYGVLAFLRREITFKDEFRRRERTQTSAPRRLVGMIAEPVRKMTETLQHRGSGGGKSF